MQNSIIKSASGCFAEMAALMPAVGAHYHYCYSTIAEIVAFIVGWHLLFAYTMITMSKCKFLSEIIDHNLLNGWVSNNLKFMEQRGFMFFCAPGYVDIISPILAVSMAFLAAWAVRATKRVVNLLTAISITVMMVLIIAFTAKMEFNQMTIENTKDSDKLFDALNTAHKALIGYESLSVLGEEAKNPTTTIPLSIIISVRIMMCVYIIYTFTISMCVKQHQIENVDLYNPIGSILTHMDMPSLQWLSILGSICSMWCSTYGSMFISIRLLYAMSRDGMFFKNFSKIDRYTRKPAIPAMIFGIFTGLAATFISVSNAVAFFSLILAKIMTNICLLITRYRFENYVNNNDEQTSEKKEKNWVLFNAPVPEKRPTEISHRLSMILIYNTVISALCSSYCVVILYIVNQLKEIFKVIGFCTLLSCLIFTVLLRFQPTNDRTNLSFLTPYVPSYPLLAIIADFLSSLILCRYTWIYGLIWTVLGVVFYFSYSIRHSQESRNLYRDGTRWNALETDAGNETRLSGTSWDHRDS